MKEFRWSALKSQRLKMVRGVSFEEINEAQVIDMRAHPSRPRQKLLFFYLKNYVWLVPCVEEEGYIFLKTLYPSHKFTQLYRKGEFYETGQID